MTRSVLGYQGDTRQKGAPGRPRNAPNIHEGADDQEGAEQPRRESGNQQGAEKPGKSQWPGGRRKTGDTHNLEERQAARMAPINQGTNQPQDERVRWSGGQRGARRMSNASGRCRVARRMLNS